MSELGVSRTVLKQVLNHKKKGDVTETYDRYEYDAEKRQALTLWAEALDQILKKKKYTKVVSIASRR